jgi:hypothetical protein
MLKFKRKTKEEEYQEIDAVRDDLGGYINFDALTDVKLLSVTRVNINEDGNDPNWIGECTLAVFCKPDNSFIEHELDISRRHHLHLINKLNNK